MSVVTTVPVPNLWNEICAEFAAKQPPFLDDDCASVATVREDYDAAKHTPVFYGDVMHKRISIDQAVEAEFDSSISHPACVGFAFVSRPAPEKPQEPPPPPDIKTCTPREYLEHYVFPFLLPALEQLLNEAKAHRCFLRKNTAFNAADFLTEYLYKNNPLYSNRENVELRDIPFVQEWWKTHPRPPLPKSVLWTEEEACLVIQSFWQGYKVRASDNVQELRQWQREWREENRTKTFSFLSDRSASAVDQQPTTPPADTQGAPDSTLELPNTDDVIDKPEEKETTENVDDAKPPDESSRLEPVCSC